MSEEQSQTPPIEERIQFTLDQIGAKIRALSEFEADTPYILYDPPKVFGQRNGVLFIPDQRAPEIAYNTEYLFPSLEIFFESEASGGSIVPHFVDESNVPVSIDSYAIQNGFVRLPYWGGPHSTQIKCGIEELFERENLRNPYKPIRNMRM